MRCSGMLRQKGRLNKKNQAVCDLEINEEEAAVVRLIFQKVCL